MRWLTTLAVFPLMALTCWIGGYDFDTRGPLQAYGFIIACAIAVAIYWYPGWDSK